MGQSPKRPVDVSTQVAHSGAALARSLPQKRPRAQPTAGVAKARGPGTLAARPGETVLQPTTAAAPVQAAVDQPDATAEEHATRAAILRLVLRHGPISAVQLARELGLAQAGIRRHLNLLESRGLIEERQTRTPNRGRGRPARYFVASQTAHQELDEDVHSLALDVLGYMHQTAGPQATRGFAQHRAGRLASRYAESITQAGPRPEDRARALASALNEDGFAASIRPGPGGYTMQLCLGHCPIHPVAAAYPEICETETAAIADLLGVHVQRLATLAGGDHVCTITLPQSKAIRSRATVLANQAGARGDSGAPTEGAQTSQNRPLGAKADSGQITSGRTDGAWVAAALTPGQVPPLTQHRTTGRPRQPISAKPNQPGE